MYFLGTGAGRHQVLAFQRRGPDADYFALFVPHKSCFCLRMLSMFLSTSAGTTLCGGVAGESLEVAKTRGIPLNGQ